MLNFFSTQRVLPPLRHAYIIPFVPSGFWPRLMSRVLSDKTMIQLERNGCNIEDNGNVLNVLGLGHLRRDVEIR